MTDLDTGQINHRASLVRALLANDPDVNPKAGEEALQRLADEDVPALLLALEEATVRRNTGYVEGLVSAARWLAAFDQEVPDLDRYTCRQLAEGVRIMADGARDRLGVEGGAATEALAAFQAQQAWVGHAALRDVTNFASLRHALNEMICAVDAVAHNALKSDRPLLPREVEEFRHSPLSRTSPANGA